MITKETFIDLIESTKDTYESWGQALNQLGIESLEDKVGNLTDAALQFAAEAMGDRGVPEQFDTDGIFVGTGYGMPIILWWAWGADWGKRFNSLKVNGTEWRLTTAAELYDLLHYLRHPEHFIDWVEQE